MPVAAETAQEKSLDPPNQLIAFHVRILLKQSTKDESEAARWFLRAAEEGHAQAQTRNAACLFHGVGISRDESAAVEWYRKAAEQGN